MRLDLPPPSRRTLSMTSLIDVIFLLLLFFMLSSTFTRYASVDLSGGASAQAVNDSAPQLLISLRGDGILVNGIEAGEDLRFVLQRHRDDAVERATVLVGVGATSQQLVTALDVARSVGLNVVVAQ